MAEQKVQFLCERYPNLVLVFKPEDVEEVRGRMKRIRPVHLAFKPNAFGVGEIVVTNLDHIEFIQERDLFRRGLIYIGDSRGLKEAKGSDEEPEVTPEPEEPPKPTRRAARVPKRKEPAAA